MKVLRNNFLSFILLTCFIFFAIGSVDESDSSNSSSTSKSNSSSSSSSNSSTKKKTKSINGTYKHESSDGYFRITISGSSWRSKHVIRTGFGDAYDEQNASYDSGYINGNDLYDSSGYIKLGYVSGNRINFSGISLYK